MTIARRSFLMAAPCLALARQARAAPALRLEPVEAGRIALTSPRIRRPLLLPAEQARLQAPLSLGGHDLAVVRFTLRDGDAVLEIAAIAQVADDAIALLALEPLAWRGADGARLNTQLAAAGDRSRLRLLRDYAVARGPTLWEREGWTDFLAWNSASGLSDAPVRPPPPDTRQYQLAMLRQRAAALVADDPPAITPAMLAAIGFQAATFSLSVKAQPSMRQTLSGPRSIV